MSYTGVIELESLDRDGKKIPSNNPAAASPDAVPYVQLRYDNFEDPNIIICTAVTGENSTFGFTIPDNLRSWYFKLYTSTDNVTFTEKKSWGGENGINFPIAEGVAASDFNNGELPESNGTAWIARPKTDFPVLSAFGDITIPMKQSGAWVDAGASIPKVSNFTANTIPVRRNSSTVWNSEKYPQRFRAYIRYDGTNVIIVNPATGATGLTAFLENTIREYSGGAAQNPTAISRSAPGVYTITFGSTGFGANAANIDFRGQHVTDEFGLIAGYVTTSIYSNTGNSVMMLVYDNSNTQADIINTYIPFFFDVIT